jgi:endoglucanase
MSFLTVLIFRLMLASLLVLLPGSLSASERDARSAQLARGVNLSHWYAQSFHGYGDSHLANFISTGDLRQIAETGFTHVRLNIEPAVVFGSSPAGALSIDERVYDNLRSSIGKALDANLAVVIDLHPGGVEKGELAGAAGAERFIGHWRLLAARLAEFNPDKVFLEVLNEPEPIGGEQWWTLQGRVLAAIRSVAPRHTVIANGGGWSGIDDLISHVPYADRNVIYTVHEYGPILFTHQASTWSWPVAQHVHGLTWPIRPADAAVAAGKQSNPAHQYIHDQVENGQFEPSWMLRDAQKLRWWQQTHDNVPIYVSEFGVYAKSAPRDAVQRWLTAAREIFESNGWGWAVWDYSDDFALVRRNGADRVFNSETLASLGMRP